jgi:carboxymethylenebutenolidase
MIDPKLSETIEEYTHEKIDRREFLNKLTVLTGSTATAMALSSLIEKKEAKASNISQEDLHTEFIKYPGETGEMIAFLARPKSSNKLPGVIVIHENRGLVPHIQDVTRRMAREGFVSIAPDALSPLGGTPEDEDKGRDMIGKLDNDSTVKNFVAAVQYLKTNPMTTGKVGCTGFCWGGGMTNQVAVNSPDLEAAVPYYGRQPNPEDVPRIKAAVLAHYAGEDERINSGIPAFEEALKKADIDYKIYIYEGASHAFNNDSNPERYNKDAAQLAWKRTIDFFKEKLKS